MSGGGVWEIFRENHSRMTRPWAEVLRKEWTGVFQRLDPDGVYSSEGVFPIGASCVSAAFKLPQSVASGVCRVSIFSQFVLIDSHFLSLRIDLFRIPALTQAGRDVMA